MAIRRHAENEKKSSTEIVFDKKYDIVMRSNLIELDFNKSGQLIQKLKNLYDLVDINSGDYLTITQGVYEIMVISNSKYEKNIKKKLEEFKIKHQFNDLCAITLTAPVEALESPGIFFRITRAFMWRNVSIIQIISTATEMTFIFNEKDATEAYDILRGLLVV